MQVISFKNYDERTNKNGKQYLVVKDQEDEAFMVKDPRMFTVVKNALVVNAEVSVDVTERATFKTITAIHEVVQAGPLPKAEPKPAYTGGGGGGGGGSYKADPQKQAYIIRQNVLDRGFDVALFAAKEGHIQPQEGQSMVAAVVQTAINVAAKLELWVRDAAPAESAAPAPAPSVVPSVVPAPAPAAEPTPAPQPVAAAVGGDDLPF